MSDLWYGTSGPQDAEIVLVGEAFGEHEAAQQVPFVGATGQELTRILADAGYDRNKILITNVVAVRPPRNEMFMLFTPKAEAPKGAEIQGLFPTPLVISEVQRLYEQINAFPRKLVIAAGNYALWALSNHTGHKTDAKSQGRRVPTGIMEWRGSMTYMLSDRLRQDAPITLLPLLPIVHPTTIFHQWSLRSITVHDLKARVKKALTADWRPSVGPAFLAPPSFEQAEGQLVSWVNHAAEKPLRLVCDIETYKQNLMTCVGWADSKNFAMAIPLVKKVPEGLDAYWPNEQTNRLVMLMMKLLRHPNIEIIGQNFIYDTQFFQHWFGVTPRLGFDTMLAHHLLFPGTPKGLDYLSSLYCHYHWYWKEDGKDWDGKGELSDLLRYNCEDCVRTFEVADTLRDLIPRFGLESQWEHVLKKNALCLRMMNRGILIDQARRNRLGGELMFKQQELENELLKIIPQDWVQEGAKTHWFNSPIQQRYLFGEILGMKLPTNRKTGQPTLGREALSELPKKYPEYTRIFSLLEALRSVDVFQSHFIRASLDPDGRMRCSFNPAGTETFRLSSSKNAFGRGTNLQNIPAGDEDQ